MRLVLVLSVLFLSLSPAFAADVAPEKRAEIERLLEATGALARGQQMGEFFVAQFTQAIRRNNPNVPEHVLEALPVEVAAAVQESLPAFREMMMPLYDKYFTLEDLQAINAFYASPVGRKSIAVMPALLQESMNLGAQWGRLLEPRIQERLRARFKKENLRI